MLVTQSNRESTAPKDKTHQRPHSFPCLSVQAECPLLGNVILQGEFLQQLGSAVSGVALGSQFPQLLALGHRSLSGCYPAAAAMDDSDMQKHTHTQVGLS